MFIEKLNKTKLNYLVEDVLDGQFEVENVSKLDVNDLPSGIKSNFKNDHNILKIDVVREPAYRYMQGAMSSLYLSDFNVEFVVKKGVSKIWSKTELKDYAIMKRIYLISMAKFFGEEYLKKVNKTKMIDKQM